MLYYATLCYTILYHTRVGRVQISTADINKCSGGVRRGRGGRLLHGFGAACYAASLFAACMRALGSVRRARSPTPDARLSAAHIATATTASTAAVCFCCSSSCSCSCSEELFNTCVQGGIDPLGLMIQGGDQ